MVKIRDEKCEAVRRQRRATIGTLKSILWRRKLPGLCYVSLHMGTRGNIPKPYMSIECGSQMQVQRLSPEDVDARFHRVKLKVSAGVYIRVQVHQTRPGFSSCMLRGRQVLTPCAKERHASQLCDLDSRFLDYLPLSLRFFLLSSINSRRDLYRTNKHLHLCVGARPVNLLLQWSLYRRNKH
jgi:hypothetical protein